MNADPLSSVSSAPPRTLPIETSPEKAMEIKDWLRAAAEIAVLATLVAPVWAAVGLVLAGPLYLLKKISSHFSDTTRKRIDQLFAFSTEIFQMFALGATYLAAYIGKVQNLEGKNRPILFVHGYLHNRSAWRFLVRTLPRLLPGIGPLYTINLGHPALSIVEYTERVAAKVDKILKKTQQQEIVLVGHSMGGLISALYAIKVDPRKVQVTDVFTLASPLDGCSSLAKALVIGPNGREMMHGSPLLAEIQRGMEAKKETIRFHHAGSDGDLCVPAQSALPDSGSHFHVSDLGHTQFLNSKRIAKWIAKRLAV